MQIQVAELLRCSPQDSHPLRGFSHTLPGAPLQRPSHHPPRPHFSHPCVLLNKGSGVGDELLSWSRPHPSTHLALTGVLGLKNSWVTRVAYHETAVKVQRPKDGGGSTQLCSGLWPATQSGATCHD